MTHDEEHPTQPDDITPEEPTNTEPPLGVPIDDDIDVEGALAAVASLHALTRDEDDEAFVEAEEEESPTEAAGADLPLHPSHRTTSAEAREGEKIYPIEQAAEPEPVPVAEPGALPPVRDGGLLRGQAASVVPAFLLMGTGAVLIFTLTTGNTLPSTPVLTGAGLVGGGIIFLSRWLSSRAVGSLLAGLLCAFLGGMLLFLSLPTSPGWAQGWPLLLVAPGVALLLSALPARESRSASLLGAVLVAAGAAIFLGNQLLPTWEPTIAQGWPFALGIGILLLIAPVLRRRRN